MYVLKNDELEIEINAHGAELVRVNRDGVDYLWNGNPEFWGRTSPVLFPIVGAVADDTYFINGEKFELSQHGFARDMDFEIVSKTGEDIWFKITSTEETRIKYPFYFELIIGYKLDGASVVVMWEVVNSGDVRMPFSIGAHPAFMTDPTISDYSLHMTDSRGIKTYVFDDVNGIVDVAAGKVQIIENLPFLPLSKDLFVEFPTLILEGESRIMLCSYNHDREVEISFGGFPFVGIWSPINDAGAIAPFVCIEPWYGMADTSPLSGELAEKKGIELLEAGEKFTASYTMTFR